MEKMKKLIYGTLFLALVGIGVVGCKKDNSITNIDSKMTKSVYTVDVIRGLEKVGSILSFKTSEDYIDFLKDTLDSKWERFDKFTNDQGFQNYFVQNPLENNDSDSMYMDEYLGKLLNSDGVVQIGDYIYKVDLLTGIVGVLNSSYSSEYDDLVALNTSNKNIRKFTTEDDVIELAESGAESTAKSCGGIDGTEQATSVVDFGTVSGTIRRCQGSVRHFVGGVFFRTTARFVPVTSGLISTELEIRGPQAWAKKRPCGSGSIVTSASGVKASGTSQQIWQFYLGSKNLNGYYLFARIKCTFNGTVLYSTWAGRNINSPY